MILNNTPIGAELSDIIAELRTQLSANGIKLLGAVRDTPDNIMVSCPYHKGGQERRPSAGIDKRTGVFHCFSGETKVITREFGAVSMASIRERPVHILNGRGEWEEVVFHNYGVQRLMKLTLSCNTKEKVIYATDQHRWILKDSPNSVCLTKDLRPGMYLQKCVPVKLPDDVEIDYQGVVHGFCYGDGNTFNHNKDMTVWYNRCYFYNEADLCLRPYFEKVGAKFSAGAAGNGKQYPYALFKSDRNYKEVPRYDETVGYLLGFLAGYFVADGNCHKNKLTIYSHKYEDLYKIQQICTKLGIMSTEIGVSNIKSGRRGCICVPHDTHGYVLRLVRNTIPDSFFIADKGCGSHQKYTGRNRYRVVSVESTDRFEDVYCCQTSTASFALEHFILTGNCFACEETHSLQEVISHCFGHYDDMTGGFGWSWILKNFLTISVEERKPIQLSYERKHMSKTAQTQYVSEAELDKYREYHPYMWKRKLTPEIVERFDIGYDSNTRCITFPVREVNGGTLFVARRSVESKFFNYPEGAEKPVYGLYELASLPEYPKEVIICESMLDALVCWVWGRPAVALNGLGNDLQFTQLNNMPCRKFILATDMDERGLAARKRIRSRLRRKIVTEFILPEGRKDMNDLTKEEFDAIEEVW